MSGQTTIWEGVATKLRTSYRLVAAMERVSRSFSEAIGRPIHNDVPRVRKMPIAAAAESIGGPEDEAVGVFLQIKGDARGLALLIFSRANALKFVDLMTDATPGTASNLGFMEGSVLAEAGNLVLASFLNALASSVSPPQRLRPSPPDVLVDRLGTILSLVHVPMKTSMDDAVIIETVLWDAGVSAQAHFWVLPYVATRRTLWDG